ncbi:MAG: D-glycerate dehydrogenase [Marinosulfonomonas sp.]|nr:MAG: D-glycerate dehydrogenase [Marinosulfonomonas sp.]
MPQDVVNATREYFDVTHRDKSSFTNEDEIRSALESYDAILPTLGDPLGAAAFSGAGSYRCKMLANFGVGVNHIDVAAANAVGITVSNTPGAVTDATADIGMMLILMAARRASEGEAILRAGKWGGWEPTQLLGLHVSGKTVGIIGMGRIGKAIARRCQLGFGMDVVFFNRSVVADPGVEAKQLDSMDAVAAQADVVVIAVPGSPATHHLIKAELFTAMQSHAVFVNISRGDVVDEPTLIKALEQGQIAGAGLDVYENEPEVPEALIKLPNVTLLPHMGTSALEVRNGMGMMALDNLIAWDKGQEPPDKV